MIKKYKYSNIIVLLNNLINTENIFNLLNELYQELENYHNLVIILKSNKNKIWDFISKIVVISENLKNIDIKNFDAINKKRKKLIEKTLGNIDYNYYYKTEIKNTFEEYYQKIFYGYYFEDLFISEKNNLKILVLKKIAPEFEKISCPVCNSLKVSGNSYHKNFIKSFECKNPECPAKSISGRGKRFDKLSIKKNKHKTNENKIDITLKKEFRKDIFNSNRLFEMLLSFYSWNNDKVLFLTDKKKLGEKKYHYRTGQNSKRIIILKNINRYIDKNNVYVENFKKNFLYNNVKKYLNEFNKKINEKFVKHVDKNIVLYKGNSKYIIPNIKNNIDYIITSPPYYNAREYSQWNNFNTFLLDMLIYGFLFKQKLKNDGLIFFNVGDISCKDNIYFISKTSKRHLSLFSYISYIWKSIGLYLIDDIIWNKGEVHSKRNSTSNLYPYYLYPINVYEHILVFSKKRKKFLLNKPHILNLSPVIKINNKKINKIKHTAPYPEKLVEYIIKQYKINKNNVILDPFMGSGTTGKVAAKFNINFIGIELNDEYFELSKKNILEK